MNEWVKISDRMPERDQQVWFYTPHRDKAKELNRPELDGIEYGALAEFTEGPAFYADGHGEYGFYIYVKEVTHWMPYFKPVPPLCQ
jgi:hypothetical protein